jgi:hypothetical protein
MSLKNTAWPLSMFISISCYRKKYGVAVQHCFDLLPNQQQLKHMDMVVWLKDEHGIGHGHANALVAYFRSKALT